MLCFPAEILVGGQPLPPNMVVLLQDHGYMDIAKRTFNDPACVELLRQMHNLYDELGKNSDARADSPVYSSAINNFMAKPELVNNMKCIKKALMQDPALLKKRTGDSAPLKRDMTEEEIDQYFVEECRKNRGDPVAIERILSPGNIFLNLIKELRGLVESESAACEEPADEYKNLEDEPYFAPKMFDADIKKKRTILHIACALNEIEEAEYQIDHGADLDALDIDGNTALHYAISHGSKLCATFLIKHGADINLRNSFGTSPYEIAESKKNTELMELLKGLC